MVTVTAKGGEREGRIDLKQARVLLKGIGDVRAEAKGLQLVVASTLTGSKCQRLLQLLQYYSTALLYMSIYPTLPQVQPHLLLQPPNSMERVTKSINGSQSYAIIKKGRLCTTVSVTPRRNPTMLTPTLQTRN